MAPPYSSRNLFVRQRRRPLPLINIPTAFNGVIEHGNDNIGLNWQLFAPDIALQLLQRHTIVKVVVQMVAQFANAFHRHLEWLISLTQILARALEIPARRYVLHANHLKLSLRLHGILINKRQGCSGLFGGDLRLDFFHNGVFFTVGFLFSSLDSFFFLLKAFLTLSILAEDVGHAPGVVEFEGQSGGLFGDGVGRVDRLAEPVFVRGAVKDCLSDLDKLNAVQYA